MKKWMNQGTTLCYNDLLNDIKLCSKWKFEAIELKYNVLKDQNIFEIKKLLEEKGVMAGSVGSICITVLRDKELLIMNEAKLRKMCEIALKLGAKYIVAYDYLGVTEKNKKETRELTEELLDKYSDIVAEYGLKLAFEVMGFQNSVIGDFFAGLEIVENIKRDNVGVLLDFYHYIHSGLKIDMLENANCNKIFMVHICDGIFEKSRVYDDYARLWPGEGNFDIPSCDHVLRSINYNNSVSLEVFQKNGWSIKQDQCYEKISECMKKYIMV